MRALRINESQLEFTSTHPAPEPQDGWTRVRVLQAGICETDLQLLAGYMDFHGILGHEFVGIAEDGPLEGKRVVGEINCPCRQCPACLADLGNHCPHRTVLGILNHDGAFADFLRLPTGNLHVVPDRLDNDLATLVEPVAAALQIPAQVAIQSGMKAAVVGDGRLGNLCAQMLQSLDCQTTVVGKHPEKLARLTRHALHTCLLNEASSLDPFDIVVDCAGSQSGIETALQLVRPRGTVVMKTTVANPHQVQLSPVVIHEISLVGSRCGPFSKAIAALQSGQFVLDDFVTSRFPLEQFQDAFHRAKEKDALKVVLQIS